MNRREFVKHSCILCAGGGLLPVVLSGCEATHYVSGTFESTGITVPKSEFVYTRNKKIAARQYIIVQNEKLEFPIYVYRFSENEFSALWMKCAHQGAELQASGDHLHCPSHGSEYTNRGVVSHGPAERNLRAFIVSSFTDKILIDLRQS